MAASSGPTAYPIRGSGSSAVPDGCWAASQVPFPIDAVYTWVDGDDPAWRRAFEQARSQVDDAADPSALARERFVHHDELKYSLRSLQRFAPWVRQVFVIVGQQPPAWLDTTNPRLRVVHHEEFMHPAGLPTFNSHSIEARLHHIDGLSEQFLYMNDDVFFGRPVDPRLFFEANGLMRFFPSPVSALDQGPVRPDDSPATAARKNARDLLRRDLGFWTTTRLRHTPHAMRRSVLAEMEQRWPGEFAATVANRWRSRGDLPVEAFMAQWYAYATARAVPADLGYGFVTVTDPLAPARYLSLIKRPRDVFCLNEPSPKPGNSAAYRLMTSFLGRYFPAASGFERGCATHGGV